MRTILKTILCVLIALHLVGGCCLHHAHGAAESSLSHACLVTGSHLPAGAEPCGECDHEHAPPGSPCHETPCDLWGGVKTELAQGFPLTAAPLALPAAEPVIVPAATARWRDLAPSRRGPLPRHLLHRVLLI
jgi:hypothetical protein